MESKTFINEDKSFHCTFSNPFYLNFLKNDNKLANPSNLNDNLSTSIECNLIYIIYNHILFLADENIISCIKKRSKISIQFEELKNKEDEYINDIIEEIGEENTNNDSSSDVPENILLSNYIDNKKDFDNINDYITFEIYFYFAINGIEYIFPIQTDFLNIKKEYGYDLIKNIVKTINHSNIIIVNNSIKYNVSLKDNEDENKKEFYINNYELRQCKKKNMMPKHDLPAYSPNSLLEKISNQKISFISKNSLNIMITEKYDDYNEECPKKDNIYKKSNIDVNIYKNHNCNNIYENPNILSLEKDSKNKNKKCFCKKDCIIM